MIQDQTKMTGRLVIELFDKDGKPKDRREIDNLVVTVGKQFIASRMVGTASAVMSHMAAGSGTAAAAAGDTTLGTELGRSALTSSASSGAVATYIATFGAGVATGAVTEAGIFNAESNGTMLARTVFPVVNKGADDGMSITWQVTVS